MGIHASYWLTGGIMTVLGLALARVVMEMLGVIAVSVGGFFLTAAAFVFKAALVLLVVWLVVRLVRSRRREAAGRV